ncbi:MAG: DNA-binding response regulator [Acidobacteria bacterium]|nr:MAG: DNA-binding response regulator [Acidobacteriota bacterium]
MHDATEGTVAVVDDEAGVLESVGRALEREGYRVQRFSDGAEAWDAFEHDKMPDLAILDILMPRMDGLELCRRLRARSEALPIIFLTSKDEEFDKVLGLELGADDYLCKPFSMRELLARVKVLFRRMALAGAPDTAAEDMVVVGPLELDLQRYLATLNGRPVALTVTEFLILCSLARRPGHVKTRQQLMDEGYPHDSFVSDRTIDSHIKRLRKKLQAVDPKFDRVQTVYGLGYRYQESAE